MRLISSPRAAGDHRPTALRDVYGERAASNWGNEAWSDSDLDRITADARWPRLDDNPDGEAARRSRRTARRVRDNKPCANSAQTPAEQSETAGRLKTKQPVGQKSSHRPFFNPRCVARAPAPFSFSGFVTRSIREPISTGDRPCRRCLLTYRIRSATERRHSSRSGRVVGGAIVRSRAGHTADRHSAATVRGLPTVPVIGRAATRYGDRARGAT